MVEKGACLVEVVPALASTDGGRLVACAGSRGNATIEHYVGQPLEVRSAAAGVLAQAVLAIVGGDVGVRGTGVVDEVPSGDVND